MVWTAAISWGLSREETTGQRVPAMLLVQVGRRKRMTARDVYRWVIQATLRSHDRSEERARLMSVLNLLDHGFDLSDPEIGEIIRKRREADERLATYEALIQE